MKKKTISYINTIALLDSNDRYITNHSFEIDQSLRLLIVHGINTAIEYR